MLNNNILYEITQRNDLELRPLILNTL